MKILLITGNYLPGKNGGIENYTHWLSGILLANNHIVEIASLNLAEAHDYVYDGIKVNFLNRNVTLFELLIKKENFDICHFHEYSENGIEIEWFRKAKEYCNKVFFTFHLPYLTCYKGDFRYKGITDCNTFTNPLRCAECVIADKINYKKLGRSEVILKAAIMMLNLVGAKGKLEKNIKQKYKNLGELVEICDEVFVIANWFKKILFENGYCSNSINKIPNKSKAGIQPSSIAQNNQLKNRIIFIGRVQYIKGLHLLCRALNKLSLDNLELDVFGNIMDKEYYEKCFKNYAFNYKGTVSHEALLEHLKDYDFLILPSVVPEMFPLVIMDAFHHELPVIASESKGNKDVVVDGKNGFLFDYDNYKALAEVIDKAYELKHNGWMPFFEEEKLPENEIRKILSYY